MTPLFHTHHRFSIPHAFRSGWVTLRRELEHLLTQFPEAEWAWLWKMRLRVFNYLIRRYGSDVVDAPTERTPPRPPQSIVAPPREPARAAPAPKLTLDETPADQLALRNAARARCSAFLADRGTINDDVQHRAEAVWRHEIEIVEKRQKYIRVVLFGAIVMYLAGVTIAGMALVAMYGLSSSPATSHLPYSEPIAIVISTVLFVLAAIMFLRSRKMNAQPSASSNGDEDNVRSEPPTSSI